MMPKIVIQVSFDRGKSWVSKEEHEIEVTTTIGRSNNADITLLYADGYLSKIHCTLFNYPDTDDLEVMDGTLLPTTIDEPEASHTTSAAGTYVNNTKLEPGQKIKLKNNDEVALVKGILKFVYIRPLTKEKDKLDETFIPEEHY